MKRDNDHHIGIDYTIFCKDDSRHFCLNYSNIQNNLLENYIFFYLPPCKIKLERINEHIEYC